MERMRLLQRCSAEWSHGGWRAWRDRVLYGHVSHACIRIEHVGEHSCHCGARLPSPFRLPGDHS